jgi:hypothetical protein
MQDVATHETYTFNGEPNQNLVSQPETLKIPLYPHQLASVYMMEKIEREKFREITSHNTTQTVYTKFAINADITGYGKSLSMIALLIRDKMEWNLSEMFSHDERVYSTEMIEIRRTTRFFRLPTTLLLVSPSLLKQWLKEFENSNLKVAEVSRKATAQKLAVADYDVVIVTPSYYNILTARFPDFAWKRFIIDEPNQTRVSAMHEIIAGFYWCISATPQLIYNTFASNRLRSNFMSKLISDNAFIFNHKLSSILVKNPDEFVKSSFEMPQTVYKTYRCFSLIHGAINGIVNNRILKMIEVGNIQGAISSLGGKQTDNIIDLVLRNKKLELEEIQSKIRIWRLRNDSEKINEWIEKETQILREIQILNERFENILNENCVICYEKINEPVMEPTCQNVFCGKCIFTWLQSHRNCPMCRANINPQTLTYINVENKKFIETQPRERSKEDVIASILSEKPNGKFIIFSESDTTFDTIRRVLEQNKILFGEIKGTVDRRSNLIARFRDGNLPVLFLNSQYNGAGINLQNATDIILYHKMPETLNIQIIGRANRIGRKESLVVHQLLYENEN